MGLKSLSSCISQKRVDMLKLLLCLLCLASLHAEQLHLVTYANRRRIEIDHLRFSAKKNHLKMIHIGNNTDIIHLSDKAKVFREFLNSDPFPDEDIVMFVDAYDVLIIQEAKEIIKEFKSYHSPIILAGERHCFPDGHLAEKYPISNSKHRYINSGCYIGYVGAIKRMLNKMPIETIHDDQRLFTHYFLFYPHEKIVIDSDCKLFLCLQDVDEKELKIDYQLQRVFFTHTRTFPCVIHGNGNGKPKYYVLARWLRKKKTQEMKRTFSSKI